MIKKTLKKGIEFGAISILILLLIYFIINSGYTDINMIKVLIENSGIYAFVLFFILFIFLSLIGISVTPLIILGGVLFGVYKGFIIAFLSLFSASILAFFLSSFISKYFKKNNKNKKSGFVFLNKVLDKINLSVETNCFKTIFFTKFFIANILVSYALGSISNRVNKLKFFLATFFNNLILCFLLIFIGNKFLENKIYLFYTLLGVLVFYLIKYFLKKYHLRNVELIPFDD